MTEYELYLPLHYNAGRPIERKKIDGLKHLLVEKFGGLTHFPQVGSHVFRDRLVIWRVLSDNRTTSENFSRRSSGN